MESRKASEVPGATSRELVGDHTSLDGRVWPSGTVYEPLSSGWEPECDCIVATVHIAGERVRFDRDRAAEAIAERDRKAHYINLAAVAPYRESTAVAWGHAVMSALESHEVVELDTGDVEDESIWSEMVAYLSRRGVTVADGDCLPVAARE